MLEGPLIKPRARGPDDNRAALAHFFAAWDLDELKKKKKTPTGEKNGQGGRGCLKKLSKNEGSSPPCTKRQQENS